MMGRQACDPEVCTYPECWCGGTYNGADPGGEPMSELSTRVRHIADEHHWREDHPGEETLRKAADRIDQLETALRRLGSMEAMGGVALDLRYATTGELIREMQARADYAKRVIEAE